MYLNICKTIALGYIRALQAYHCATTISWTPWSEPDWCMCSVGLAWALCSQLPADTWLRPLYSLHEYALIVQSVHTVHIT